MPDLVPLLHAAAHMLRARLTPNREKGRHNETGRQHVLRDGGYTTEALVATALLVAIAVAAFGILSAKVLAKAQSLNLG